MDDFSDLNSTSIRLEAERRVRERYVYRPNPDPPPLSWSDWLRSLPIRWKLYWHDVEYHRRYGELVKSFEADGHGRLEAGRRAREFEASMLLMEECARDVMNTARYRHGAWEPELARDWIAGNQAKLGALGPRAKKAIEKTLADDDSLFDVIDRITDDESPKRLCWIDYVYRAFLLALMAFNFMGIYVYLFGN